MFKKHGKKKIIAAGAVLFTAATVLSSTYLWFSKEERVENIFNVETFDVELTEKFDPNDPVIPGVEVDKEVGVTNKSKIPVAVRVRLEESLQLLDMDDKKNPKISYSNVTEVVEGQILVTVAQSQIDNLIDSGYEEITSTVTAPTGVKVFQRTYDSPERDGVVTEYFAYQSLAGGAFRLVKYDPDATDKFTYAYYTQGTRYFGYHGNTSSVEGEKDIPHDNGITVNTDSVKWRLDASTGWYYYEDLLLEGQTSGNIIKSVSFAETIDNELKGAVYTLTPILQATQAVNDAVEENWGTAAAAIFVINETNNTVTINLP